MRHGTHPATKAGSKAASWQQRLHVKGGRLSLALTHVAQVDPATHSDEPERQDKRATRISGSPELLSWYSAQLGELAQLPSVQLRGEGNGDSGELECCAEGHDSFRLGVTDFSLQPSSSGDTAGTHQRRRTLSEEELRAAAARAAAQALLPMTVRPAGSRPSYGLTDSSAVAAAISASVQAALTSPTDAQAVAGATAEFAAWLGTMPTLQGWLDTAVGGAAQSWQQGSPSSRSSAVSHHPHGGTDSGNDVNPANSQTASAYRAGHSPSTLDNAHSNSDLSSDLLIPSFLGQQDVSSYSGETWDHTPSLLPRPERRPLLQPSPRSGVAPAASSQGVQQHADPLASPDVRQLTARLKNAVSVQQLCDLVDGIEHELDHIHISAALVRLAHLHRQAGAEAQFAQGATALWQSLALSLLEELPRVMPRIGHRQVANMLWALGVLGGPCRHPAIYQLVQKMRCFWKEVNALSISNALWGMARLGERPKALWMQEFDQHTPRLLHTCSAQELSNIAWALAALRCRPSAEWLNALPSAIPKAFAIGAPEAGSSSNGSNASGAVDSTSGGSGSANAQSASCLLWSCAVLHVNLTAPARAALSRVLQSDVSLAVAAPLAAADAPLPHADGASASASSSSASSRAADPAASQPAAAFALPSPHTATISLWSLAALRLRPSSALLDGLLKASLAAMPHASSQAAANALWALGQMCRHPPAEWLVACLQNLERHALAGELEGRSFAAAMHAMGALFGHTGQALPPSVVPALTALLTAVQPCLASQPRQAARVDEEAEGREARGEEREQEAEEAEGEEGEDWLGLDRLCVVLHALTRCSVPGAGAGDAPSSVSACPPAFAQAVLVAASRQLERAGPRELACIGWCTARLGLVPPAAWLSAFRARLQQVVGSASTASANSHSSGASPSSPRTAVMDSRLATMTLVGLGHMVPAVRRAADAAAAAAARERSLGGAQRQQRHRAARPQATPRPTPAALDALLYAQLPQALTHLPYLAYVQQKQQKQQAAAEQDRTDSSASASSSSSPTHHRHQQHQHQQQRPTTPPRQQHAVFSGADLADALWACACLGHTPPHRWQETMWGISRSAAATLSGPTICKLLSACARLRLEPPQKWLRAIVGEATATATSDATAAAASAEGVDAAASGGGARACKLQAPGVGMEGLVALVQAVAVLERGVGPDGQEVCASAQPGTVMRALLSSLTEALAAGARRPPASPSSPASSSSGAGPKAGKAAAAKAPANAAATVGSGSGGADVALQRGVAVALVTARIASPSKALLAALERSSLASISSLSSSSSSSAAAGFCPSSAALACDVASCFSVYGHAPSRQWAAAWFRATAPMLSRPSAVASDVPRLLALARALLVAPPAAAAADGKAKHARVREGGGGAEAPPPAWLAAACGALERHAEQEGLVTEDTFALLVVLEGMWLRGGGESDAVRASLDELARACTARLATADAAASDAASSPPPASPASRLALLARLNGALHSAERGSGMQGAGSPSSVLPPPAWAIELLQELHAGVFAAPAAPFIAQLELELPPLQQQQQQTKQRSRKATSSAAAAAAARAAFPSGAGAALSFLLASLQRFGLPPPAQGLPQAQAQASSTHRWVSALVRRVAAWDATAGEAPSPSSSSRSSSASSAHLAAAAAREEEEDEGERGVSDGAWRAEDVASVLSRAAALGYVPPSDVAAQAQAALAPALARLAPAQAVEVSIAWRAMGRPAGPAWWRTLEGALTPRALHALHAPALCALLVEIASMAADARGSAGLVPSAAWRHAALAALARACTSSSEGPSGAGVLAAAAGGGQHALRLAQLAFAVGCIHDEALDALCSSALVSVSVSVSVSASDDGAQGEGEEEGEEGVDAAMARGAAAGLAAALFEASLGLLPAMDAPSLVLLAEGVARLGVPAPAPWGAAYAQRVEQLVLPPPSSPSPPSSSSSRSPHHAAAAATPHELCSFVVCMLALRIAPPSAPWLAGVLQPLVAAAPAMVVPAAPGSGTGFGAGSDRLRDVIWAVRAMDNMQLSGGAVASAFVSALEQRLGQAHGAHGPAHGSAAVPPVVGGSGAGVRRTTSPGRGGSSGGAGLSVRMVDSSIVAMHPPNGRKVPSSKWPRRGSGIAA